jgi:putative transcriptional regulator
MTEINHHLTDEYMMAYAAGTLPEAFSLVVAAHVSMCDECRARLHAFEAVGGSVLDEGETAALADGSLAATMARIAEGPREPIRVAPKRNGILPGPLAEYVGGGVEDVKWRSLGRGVKQAILPTSKEASVRLLLIPAGMAMPDHGHKGREITLVLQGAFRDDDGRYRPGDVEIADPSVEHKPVAEAGEDCICLAATDARLKFNALLPRIVQPFFRI